jgi:hypothetical protein
MESKGPMNYHNGLLTVTKGGACGMNWKNA